MIAALLLALASDGCCFGSLPYWPAIFTVPPQPVSVSASAGGTVDLFISGGPSTEGACYGEVAILLGSLSGMAPGQPLGKCTLPLNVDAYLVLTLQAPFAPPLSPMVDLTENFHRVVFSLPPGSAPALAGLDVSYALLTLDFDGKLVSTSNAVQIQLVG